MAYFEVPEASLEEWVRALVAAPARAAKGLVVEGGPVTVEWALEAEQESVAVGEGLLPMPE